MKKKMKIYSKQKTQSENTFFIKIVQKIKMKKQIIFIVFFCMYVFAYLFSLSISPKHIKFYIP